MKSFFIMEIKKIEKFVIPKGVVTSDWFSNKSEYAEENILYGNRKENKFVKYRDFVATDWFLSNPLDTMTRYFTEVE